MTRIIDTIKEINERLDLPQPIRSQVLLEIAADLRDLEMHFLEKGLSREEAQIRAVEICDLSDEAVSQLIHVHAGVYRRFLQHFSAQARTWWERVLLAVNLVFFMGTAGKWMLTEHFFTTANPIVWPIMATTILAILLVLPKYYSAYLKQDHNPMRLRTGLSLIPVIAVINLLIGIYGFWLALYPILRKAVGDQDGILPSVFTWLESGSAMLIVCLLSVIAITVLWFILTNKIARIEQAEATVLLAEE